MTGLGNLVALPPAAGWVPVLHQMVDSGDLAKLHPSAAALYLAIKRHADYHSGLSSVSNSRLLRETGISKPTFYKARESLRAFGYISFSEDRHPTVYTIHEKVQHVAADRTPVACSTFPFVPARLMKLLDALRSQPLTRDLLGTTITIGSINIQINVLPGAPVDNGSGVDQGGNFAALKGSDVAMDGSQIAPFK